MTAFELAKQLNLTQLGAADGSATPITGLYACDLLSLVMGKAPADCAWLTVMGNLNAVAVATLADIGCIILCHGMPMDTEGLTKANEQEVPVFMSMEPVIETARKIDRLIG